jgi:hypothetical protein
VTEAPSSRVSSVVSMLGDLTAFAASFLILGEVIAAGALGIAPFYVVTSLAIPAIHRTRLHIDRNSLFDPVNYLAIQFLCNRKSLASTAECRAV